MNYAFMTFSTPELDLDGVLATAGKYGYDGVELRVQSGHAHGVEPDSPPDVRERARASAERSGVRLCCVATSCRFADPEDRAEHIADAEKAIDLAADVGAGRVRVFGGMYPDNVSRNQAIDFVSGALSDLGDRATERGVTLCLETHDAWYDPKYVVRVLEKANKPSVAANWDVLHPVRFYAASVEESFRMLKPWIRHVHFHDGVRDPSFRLASIGEGIVDHKRVVELLLEDGYEDFLSGEWIRWGAYDEVLPRELAIMKRYEREAGGEG